MKKIFLTIALFYLASEAFSQQDPMFTHYMYNTLAVNPAYAGTRDALTITGLHRSQWVGFDGAPTTQTLTAHMPILNNKLGIGLSLLNDKIGPTKNRTVNVDLAYHLPLTSTSKLSFGLKIGGGVYSNNLTSLALDQQGNLPDNSFNQNVKTRFNPNFGFGLYYHRERFYLGLSTPQIVQNKLGGDGLAATSKQQRSYYLIAGSVFDVTNEVKFKPTTLVKATTSAPIEVDLTASFLIHDRLSLGAMYRTVDAAGFLIGYNITNQLNAGYSFDWSFVNSTSRYNHGSHEIMLRYDLIFKKEGKIKSPRYF